MATPRGRIPRRPSQTPAASDGPPAFGVVACPCGAVLLDVVQFVGLVRVRCRACKRRIWIAGDDLTAAAVVLIDSPTKRIKS